MDSSLSDRIKGVYNEEVKRPGSAGRRAELFKDETRMRQVVAECV